MTSKIIKSYPSTDRSFVLFINRTSRDVDILWYDFEGRFVRYAVLSKMMGSAVNTFSKHPWGCVDHQTAAPLLLNNAFVYYPLSVEPSRWRSPRCGRQRVFISVPVFSLKDLSCHTIMRHLRCEEDVDTFNIPRTLKEYIRGFYLRKTKYLEGLITS